MQMNATREKFVLSPLSEPVQQKKLGADICFDDFPRRGWKKSPIQYRQENRNERVQLHLYRGAMKNNPAAIGELGVGVGT